MYGAWRTVACRKTSSMDNSPEARGQWYAQPSDSRTPACDMKACDISPNGWKAVAEDRTAWRHTTRRGIERADVKKHQHAAEKRLRRKQKAALPALSSCFVCLAAARTATQESAFTATMDAAKIRQFDNRAHLRYYALPTVQ